MLNDDEVSLLARHFHARDDANFFKVAISQVLGQPGVAQAAELLFGRLGLEFAVFHAALMRQVGHFPTTRRMTTAAPSHGSVRASPVPGPALYAPQSQSGLTQQPGDIINAMAALHEQHRLGSLTDEEVAARNSEYLATLRASSEVPSVFSTISSPSPWPARTLPIPADRFGSGPWPATSTLCTPVTMFAAEAGILGYDVEPGWSAVPEEQRAVYRARSETLRREAWAQHETTLAERPAPSVLPLPEQGQHSSSRLSGLMSRGERLAGVPARPGIITGLGKFRDEQEFEWQEVLRRWETLPKEQRQTYEARAATVNASAKAAFDGGAIL
ncbi:uncharacterized protein BDZ83DRAFT_227075 [Colletotrichum acutatum]|uniref:Uncharacterized protein n=1 Tax=Glomerella acutata TaxID=27357 RepID=A0AAD8UTJ2_GLOAC|nr:uncharacterized protein BDZ83DRAFT_227075 [Colletotrichum acutatum]KAK1727061.1 hypothetical protein BDZ83DRAFT_227075 [Colletotrichum acutatum]